MGKIHKKALVQVSLFNKVAGGPATWITNFSLVLHYETSWKHDKTTSFLIC